MGADNPGAEIRIGGLRSQLPARTFAFGAETPRLRWQLDSDLAGIEQLAYVIEASGTDGFSGALTSGLIRSSQQIGVAPPGGPLRSREVRFYRVRAETSHGATPWSASLRLEASLLLPSDWVGEAITLRDDPGEREQSPAPLLRRAFNLDGTPREGRLFVTSLGVHMAWLNGRRIGDQLLSPGWTSYRHRVLADSHDVSDLLVPGPNVLAVALGDGWYRGRLGWIPGGDRARFGGKLALLAQLEVSLEHERSILVATDEAWRAHVGAIRRADIYDGTLLDLRMAESGWDRPGFDDRAWEPAAVTDFDHSLIESRMTAPVRIVGHLPVGLTAADGGRTRIDSGQNLAGYLRLRARGAAGDRVLVRHAEVREAGGALHTRALRSARAVDEYVLADDSEAVLEPPFTFHGFRYADVESAAKITEAEVVAISSDLPVRSSFECAHEGLNRLHENVLWSLRSNFVSIPTDCPQRDERLGWTGDAQAFAATACTLVEAEAFWQGWLRDLELDQDDILGVPSVVPDVVLGDTARFGRAGWADAATIVPWAVYESYGDPHILQRQFDSMRRWVESLMRRRGPDGLLIPSWQFGDWLDPDAPPDQPWRAKCDPDYIANAYFSWSARLLGESAAVLKEAAVADAFAALADQISGLTWERWGPGVVANQTGCAIAIGLQIAPDTERASVADALAHLVDEAGGRVATGFLGTPLVLPALAAHGRFESAYRMLLNTAPPSWLYQIGQGATTMWERWDAIRPDGSIHPGTMSPPPGSPSDEEGHMLSFNHYAYGAVIDWVYRHVAGIAPVRSAPGYREVRFAPRPARGIDWARASVESPYGRTSIDWRLNGGALLADVVLPLGAAGSFAAPVTADTTVLVDGVRTETPSADIRLTSGTHHLEVRQPAVVAAFD